MFVGVSGVFAAGVATNELTCQSGYAKVIENARITLDDIGE